MAESLLTLAEARAHLNMDDSDTSQDPELARMLLAASAVIVGIVGPCTPTPQVELFDGGDQLLPLSGAPLLSVQRVLVGGREMSPSSYVVDVRGGCVVALSGTFGWAGRRTVAVEYTAGRTELPENVRLATLELVRHVFSWSQQGVRAQFGAAGDDAISTTGYALPNRVKELLQPDALGPVAI